MEVSRAHSTFFIHQEKNFHDHERQHGSLYRRKAGYVAYCVQPLNGVAM
jgi:hypothetical protein